MTEASRYCENCGTEIGQSTNFCPNCGAAQRADPEPPTETPSGMPETGSIPTSYAPDVPPPPRAGGGVPNWGKLALGGCGLLVLLFVLMVACAIAVGTGESDATKTAESDDEEEKKGAKEKGEETVAIGQPLTVGDVRWVVTDARQADQLVQQGISARNAKTEQGNYVIVDFAFRNDGSEAITLDNESLKLVDSQGRESGTRAELSSYAPEDRRIFLERINPGVTE